MTSRYISSPDSFASFVGPPGSRTGARLLTCADACVRPGWRCWPLGSLAAGDPSHLLFGAAAPMVQTRLRGRWRSARNRRRHRPVSRGSGKMSMAIDSPRNSGVRRTWRSIEDADIV